MATSEPPASPESPNPQELRKALKAFKKRLKLTRLDDESRLGGGPMSGGGQSAITAITPPTEYPQAVWEALAAQGRLRYAGHGLYELVRRDT